MTAETTPSTGHNSGIAGDKTVVLVDESGKEVRVGSLVTFRSDGTVYLHSAINKEYGLRLTTSGQPA